MIAITRDDLDKIVDRLARMEDDGIRMIANDASDLFEYYAPNDENQSDLEDKLYDALADLWRSLDGADAALFQAQGIATSIKHKLDDTGEED